MGFSMHGVQGVDELRRSWKLQEDAGGSLLTLTKEDGNSKLVITVDVNSQVNFAWKFPTCVHVGCHSWKHECGGDQIMSYALASTAIV